MSGVSAGRFATLIRKTMFPWSSFDTAVVVMSGAAASSPIESLNVCEFALAPAEPPSAIAGVTTSTARASPSTIVRCLTPAIYPRAATGRRSARGFAPLRGARLRRPGTSAWAQVYRDDAIAARPRRRRRVPRRSQPRRPRPDRSRGCSSTPPRSPGARSRRLRGRGPGWPAATARRESPDGTTSALPGRRAARFVAYRLNPKRGDEGDIMVVPPPAVLHATSHGAPVSPTGRPRGRRAAMPSRSSRCAVAAATSG